MKRILFYQGSTLIALNKILRLYANIMISKCKKKKYLYSQFEKKCLLSKFISYISVISTMENQENSLSLKLPIFSGS